jgi:hypothetical protein
MYTLEQAPDWPFGFMICEDGEWLIDTPSARVSTSDRAPEDVMRYESVQIQRARLQRFVDAANYGIGAISDFDPMSPDYAALSQHEPTSQYRDSRDAAEGEAVQ